MIFLYPRGRYEHDGVLHGQAILMSNMWGTASFFCDPVRVLPGFSVPL